MIKIRRFKLEDDLHDVVELLHKSMNRNCEDDTEYVDEMVEKIVSKTDPASLTKYYVYVAVEGQKVVGIIRFALSYAGVVEICPLVVSEKVRDMDVAQLLLKKTIDLLNKYRSRRQGRRWNK